MRKLILRVANSLDNFIARADGSVDWILWNAEAAAQMTELWKNIDTVLMGRNTWEFARAKGWGTTLPARVFVFSRTMAPTEGITVVSRDPGEFVRQLKSEPGKDILLMSGGELVKALLEAGVLDEIGCSIHPLLLGAGVPLLPAIGRQVNLELTRCRALSNGVVWLDYRVLHQHQHPAPPPESPRLLANLTEDELVREIALRAHDPARRSWYWEGIWRHHRSPNQLEGLRLSLERDARIRRREIPGATAHPDPTHLPPIPIDSVRRAEARTGFPFPPLLARLWTEVGNGGFGPGYGIFGCDPDARTSAPRLFAALRTQNPGWPENLLPLCDWGGDDFTAVDCSTPDGAIVDVIEGIERRPKGMALAQWLESWVNGVDLFDYRAHEEDE